jgi:hypothetical protein
MQARIGGCGPLKILESFRISRKRERQRQERKREGKKSKPRLENCILIQINFQIVLVSI